MFSPTNQGLTMPDRAPPNSGHTPSTHSKPSSRPDEPEDRATAPSKGRLPATLKWIPDNWTYSNIKPVIRCAFAAWISSVLFVIPKVEIFMGQVRKSCKYAQVKVNGRTLIISVVCAWSLKSHLIFTAKLTVLHRPVS